MSEIQSKFEQQYAEWRKRSGMTYRELAVATGIAHSALVAMRTGNRPCGEQSARRLAAAFGLSGEAREAFVLSALSTSKEKVLATVAEYPAELINVLGLLLQANGVRAKQITDCELAAVIPAGQQNEVRLSLKGGRTARLQVTLHWGA